MRRPSDVPSIGPLTMAYATPDQSQSIAARYTELVGSRTFLFWEVLRAHQGLSSTEYQGHTDKVTPVFDGAHALQRLSTVLDGFFVSQKGGA